MNKETFLNLLANEMKGFSYAEISRAQVFYEEAIADRMEDGLTEEEAVASLGEVALIVEEMRLNLPFTKLIGNTVKESHQNASNKTLWKVLAIISFPFWLPMLIGFAATLFGLYMGLIGILVGIIAIYGSLIIIGIASLFASGYFIFQGDLLVAIGYLGSTLASIGLFLLLLQSVSSIIKSVISLPVTVTRSIKKLLFKKGENNENSN